MQYINSSASGAKIELFAKMELVELDLGTFDGVTGAMGTLKEGKGKETRERVC